MTDTSTTSESRDNSRVAWYIAATAVLAVVMTAVVVFVEVASGHGDVNWTLFAIISVLLFVTETRSSSWLRFSDGGVVTPSWTFTFALMLLGSPTGAIAVMALTTITADLRDKKALRKIVFNTGQISLSLAIGAVVLFAFGIHGPILSTGHTPISWAIAMALSGVIVFGTNGVIICRLLATIEKTTFWAMMRDSFALSMSADAAMLAMAPILVISAQNSLLMLPLIGTATFFVYQTARSAIHRAHEANHDALTQLLNRRAFGAELDEFVASAPANGATGGVFILDLDRFKEVNDRLGHRTGDHVLQAFGERLTGALSGDAIVARLGGDEFAVLVTATSFDEVDRIARDLHVHLSKPLTVDGFPISAGTSIGVSHYPDHGSTPSELLHAADVAMYRAKRFRSGVELYESLGSTQQKGRVELLGDLADAIEQKQFFLEYQTQIDMATGDVTSVEALLRWNHPVHGLVLPAEFVALAEQTDLIAPLTEFVLEQAIMEAAALPRHIRVAINVSARNLQDRHFASSLLTTLESRQFPAERLECEITESALALEPERTMTAIEELRAAGVRVAIDDFGTGYSSFATLRELTVDTIKIDRSFVTHASSCERDAQIITTLIDLAHRLDLGVVAEGIETGEVYELLATMGCDVAQGFHISRPTSMANIVASLRGHPTPVSLPMLLPEVVG